MQKPSFKEEKTVSAMSASSNATIMGIRKETDSLGEVDVPSAKLWGGTNSTVRLNISA